MARRVVAVDAAPEDGDCHTARLKGAPVRLSIHAASKSAHNDKPGCGQLAAEQSRHLRAVRRAGAGSDDGDRPLLEQLVRARTAQEQPGRRIVELAQKPRESRVRPPHEAEVLRLERLQEPRRVEPPPEAPEPMLPRLVDHVRSGLGGECDQRKVAHRDPSSVGERNDSASATCSAWT